MRNVNVRFLRLVASPCVLAGLVAIALPIAPASARNSYQTCAADLVRTKLTPNEAAIACAQALYPEDLAACVVTVSGQTFAAGDALAACRQVRRPVTMAECVVDIRKGTQNSAIAEVVDNCRRSLLPDRYAECVLGVSNELKFSPTQAMTSCIDARDRIREVYPSFIPISDASQTNSSSQ